MRHALRATAGGLAWLSLAAAVGAATAGAAESKQQAAPAGAASLTISPVILPLKAKAGQTIVQPVTVTARGGPLVVEFQHADFGFTRDSYAVRIIEDAAKRTTPFSTRGWFSAPPGPYRLKAGQSRDIPVRIKVPKGTPAGEYLGVAFFRTVPKDEGGGTRILTSARSGPLVFLTVGGKTKPGAELGSIDAPRVQRHGPVAATVTVHNEGHSHVTFTGTISMRGRGHHWSRTIPERYSVPGIDRRLRARLGSKHMAPGRYVTEVKLRVSPGGRTLRTSTTTWIVPLWLWVTLGALAAIFAALVALGIRWLRERMLLAGIDLDDEDDVDWLDEEDPDAVDVD
jgi:hypothetical protein